MLVASVVLLLVVVAASVLSLHLGPHGLVVSGLVGVAAACVLIVDIVFLANAASLGLSLVFLAIVVVISMAALGFGVRTIRTSRGLALADRETKLLYASGVALTDLTPMGTVRILGETWSAESLSGAVKAGVEVYVSEIDGLRLKVYANPTLSQRIEQEKNG